MATVKAIVITKYTLIAKSLLPNKACNPHNQLTKVQSNVLLINTINLVFFTTNGLAVM